MTEIPKEIIFHTEINLVPEFPKFKLDIKDWRDGVIVRSPNWLGDAVMTLPALMQLKKIIPSNCGLFIISPSYLEDFYRALPMVDDIVNLRELHSFWNKHTRSRIRYLQPGIGILFNNSLRDTISMRLARVPKLFGASARGRKILLTAGYQFPPRLTNQLNNFHHIARYLAIAYALGAPEWHWEQPEFIVPDEPEMMKREILDVCEKPKIMAVSAGAAYGQAKCWSTENFKQLIGEWINNNGIAVILGTAKETGNALEIIADLPEEKALDLTGKTTLPELMTVLKASTVCVANDSGIMHLAAALGTKGVALYGSTDPTATSPISRDWILLFDKQDCSPCFSRECPTKNYRCFSSLKPDLVNLAVKQVLNA